MNAKPQSQKVLYIGIDWADQEHVCCLVSPDHTRIETLEHKPEAIAAWVAGLKKRFPKHRLLLSLEQSRGALLSALAEYQQLELYPINPKQLSSYRDALFPSGAKDDPGDARLLARFLKDQLDQLRRWQPGDVETRRIAELAELRRKLVDERKRLVMQLRSSLKMYFPLVLTLVRRALHSGLALDLLKRWPTLAQLKRAHPKTLRKFLAGHGERNAEKQTAFIEAARSALPLTKDKAIIAPRALYVRTLIAQIGGLNRAIAEFDGELQQAVQVHPDEAIFRGLPGAGDALVPRLVAAFGSNRAAFESAEQLQCYSGIAPVTRRSGKSHTVHKRVGCPKFLRQTFHEFANGALKQGGWSQAYYEMRRAGGMKHNAAVRSLAFKWIRIMFRLWKTRTIYDESMYIRQLKHRNSPTVEFLKIAKSK